MISSASAGARRGSERSKALYTIPEDQALRFVDGDNGFIIPVARKRRLLLTALPPEGQAAYRLFYDAEARKLFDEAERPGGAEKPRASLLRLFHHVRRRQCRRSSGRSLLRARALRSRRRLLAGHLARAPRHRPIARFAVGEGRSGAFSSGPAGRIRADQGRAGGSIQRREGHPGRADSLAGRCSSVA